MTQTPRRWVAFDLGGVLYDTEVERFALAAGQAFGCTEPQLVKATFTSGLWHQVETGALDGEGFLRGLLGELGIAADPQALETLRRGWLDILALRPGVPALLDRLRAPAVVWSNTDPIHGGSVRDASPLGRRLQGWYFSCELGVEKPSAVFFQRALEHMGCMPARVCYVDDRPDNVAAARSLGVDAFLASSLAGVETGLACRGLLAR